MKVPKHAFDTNTVVLSNKTLTYTGQYAACWTHVLHLPPRSVPLLCWKPSSCDMLCMHPFERLPTSGDWWYIFRGDGNLTVWCHPPSVGRSSLPPPPPSSWPIPALTPSRWVERRLLPQLHVVRLYACLLPPSRWPIGFPLLFGQLGNGSHFQTGLEKNQCDNINSLVTQLGAHPFLKPIKAFGSNPPL